MLKWLHGTFGLTDVDARAEDNREAALSQSSTALTLIRPERRDVVLSQSPGVTEKIVVDIDRFFLSGGYWSSYNNNLQIVPYIEK